MKNSARAPPPAPDDCTRPSRTNALPIPAARLHARSPRRTVPWLFARSVPLPPLERLPRRPFAASLSWQGRCHAHYTPSVMGILTTFSLTPDPLAHRDGRGGRG